MHQAEYDKKHGRKIDESDPWIKFKMQEKKRLADQKKSKNAEKGGHEKKFKTVTT